MSLPQAAKMTTPSPSRARSVSQPIREGVVASFLPSYIPPGESTLLQPPRSAYHRSQSSGIIQRAASAGLSGQQLGTETKVKNPAVKGRARSSSLMTVTEVGGDEPETVVDRLGVGTNENANWVNAPGAWIIHPVLILFAKILIDIIPGVTQDLSWTFVNLGYMAVSFLMFHQVTGVPFEQAITSSGAFDELTLWEQIDSGAQYTPAKKWLTSVPIGLFLISTHYTRYDWRLFALNFAALVFVLFPKLPILHRLRIQVLPAPLNTDALPTPMPSRPPTPPRSF